MYVYHLLHVALSQIVQKSTCYDGRSWFRLVHIQGIIHNTRKRHRKVTNAFKQGQIMAKPKFKFKILIFALYALLYVKL